MALVCAVVFASLWIIPLHTQPHTCRMAFITHNHILVIFLNISLHWCQCSIILMQTYWVDLLDFTSFVLFIFNMHSYKWRRLLCIHKLNPYIPNQRPTQSPVVGGTSPMKRTVAMQPSHSTLSPTDTGVPSSLLTSI